MVCSMVVVVVVEDFLDNRTNRGYVFCALEERKCIERWSDERSGEKQAKAGREPTILRQKCF